jgi:hypothetical protein
MESTEQTSSRRGVASPARAVLAVCIVAALVLLAGLAVVTVSATPLRALGANGACGGWSDDLAGRDETRITAGFVLRNPTGRPVTIRGVRATWDERLESVHIVLAEQVRGSGDGTLIGTTPFVLDGARVLDAHEAVIAPHENIRVAAEMQAKSLAHGGHLTGLRVTTAGPLGTLRTQDLTDVTVGMTTPGSDAC